MTLASIVQYQASFRIRGVRTTRSRTNAKLSEKYIDIFSAHCFCISHPMNSSSTLAVHMADFSAISSTCRINTQGTLLLNGQPTTTLLLSTSELASSPLLHLLAPLINNAFFASHHKDGHEYIPSSVPRLQNKTQILDELGPDAFTFIVGRPVDSDGEFQVYATASAKPYNGDVAANLPDANRRFKRVAKSEPIDTNVEQWEAVLMAVHTSFTRQGLATRLLSMLEHEVIKRTQGKGKEVQMILTTMKETNLAFYTKRGYTLTGERKIESGTFGNRDGFSIAEMMKKL